MDGARRVAARRVRPRPSASAWSSPTPARRATRASTTGRSPSAASTATPTCSPASTPSSGPRRGCARRSSAATGRRPGAALADEWRARIQLAPAVTTPAIDALLAEAIDAGAWAGKVCGAGGGGCLFCLAPPERTEAIRRRWQLAGATVLETPDRARGRRVTRARDRRPSDDAGPSIRWPRSGGSTSRPPRRRSPPTWPEPSSSSSSCRPRRSASAPPCSWTGCRRCDRNGRAADAGRPPRDAVSRL